ncbi:MAG: hypothetical protein RI900_1908 [Actinomycetota bacterium]|jgi:hypothetical protein
MRIPWRPLATIALAAVLVACGVQAAEDDGDGGAAVNATLTPEALGNEPSTVTTLGGLQADGSLSQSERPRLRPDQVAERSVAANGKTYGRLPADHGGATPQELYENAPDFISVLDADGLVAGFVEKQVLTPEFATSGESLPVYASDLVTVVGSWTMNKGFQAGT